MPTHPLTSFEIQNYYQNEPKLSGAYSRYNLPKRKDGAYLINIDEFKSIGIHWIALYVNGNNGNALYGAIYFNNFAVEHISKKIKKNHRKQKNHNKHS